MATNDGGIFLRSDDKLTVMREEPYETEAVLQEALARFPEVIAGVSTADDDAGGLVLIRAEKAVPGASSAESTMSLDHLFVDGRGIPVLVEVKRSTDTRIRREVVGQLLDYAANAVRNWPAGSLRRDFESQFTSPAQADERLAQIGSDRTPDEFWGAVDDNLADGRLRLIIVADRLPAGLVRIIEFLNEQMRPAEFLGVEVAQHVGEDNRHVVYVPRLKGQTTKAQDTKATVGSKRRWERDSYLAEVGARNEGNPAAVRLVSQLLHDADHVNLGSGAEPGVGGWYSVAGARTGVWELYGGGGPPAGQPSLTIALNRIAVRVGNDRAADIAAALERIPAFSEPVKAWRSLPSRQPSGKLGLLAENADEIESLFAIIHELIDRESDGVHVATVI